MKLITILLLFLSIFIFADESIIMDFSNLNADTEGENTATLFNYAPYLPEGYTGDNNISLAIENWVVLLNPSSQTVENEKLSYTKEAPSKVSGNVLGIRIHFPITPSNAYADILPPFEIPVFNEQGLDFTQQLGIVKNVGELKTVKVKVYGKNFPHTLYSMFEDQKGELISIPMGSLQFLGWKELVWENASYIDKVENRKLVALPEYPRGSKFLKFIGFRIFRHNFDPGGDVIFYAKDVTITYDKAELDSEPDFNDEEIWGIIEERELQHNKDEMEKIATLMYLRQQEELKMTD